MTTLAELILSCTAASALLIRSCPRTFLAPVIKVNMLRVKMMMIHVRRHKLPRGEGDVKQSDNLLVIFPPPYNSYFSMMSEGSARASLSLTESVLNDRCFM